MRIRNDRFGRKGPGEHCDVEGCDRPVEWNVGFQLNWRKQDHQVPLECWTEVFICGPCRFQADVDALVDDTAWDRIQAKLVRLRRPPAKRNYTVLRFHPIMGK